MYLEPFHLTYCLNIYQAESWEQVFRAIKKHCLEVKQKVCSIEKEFALGLRLSAKACQNLTDNPKLLEKFYQWLQINKFYVFTINIFPYGQFHQTVVKENVYFPDWSVDKRIIYTKQASDILAYLLPKGIEGSLSTVPITYGKVLPDNIYENLASCAKYLLEIKEKKGKKIVLALEPEPDCYLETTQETIDFFSNFYQAFPELSEYIGVCFDTCHIALQFEDLSASLIMLKDAGIKVAKVQLSSALVFDNEQQSSNYKVLKSFAEPIYLHQVKVKKQNQLEVFSYSDLPDALEQKPQGQWRIHFHLPLYLAETNLGIKTTNQLLTTDFFISLQDICPYLEVETYTFEVFEECDFGVDESVVKELIFVKEKLSSIFDK